MMMRTCSWCDTNRTSPSRSSAALSWGFFMFMKAAPVRLFSLAVAVVDICAMMVSSKIKPSHVLLVRIDGIRGPLVWKKSLGENFCGVSNNISSKSLRVTDGSVVKPGAKILSRREMKIQRCNLSAKCSAPSIVILRGL
jgi:hypothetical protein